MRHFLRISFQVSTPILWVQDLFIYFDKLEDFLSTAFYLVVAFLKNEYC